MTKKVFVSGCYDMLHSGHVAFFDKAATHQGLPTRSTTAIRKECLIPFRLDLAGRWLDQPYVSKFYPGPVITISIEPEIDFNDRSGMSSSTRAKGHRTLANRYPGR